MSRVNVLIVDDRPENLLALESTLSGMGPHLEFVRSAGEALRYLLTEEVALILLDVQMPGVSGFELAELIRQRENTQNTPIIFISATSTDRHYVFRGYSLGAVDYLTKPFEPEILKSKVAFFTTLYEKNSEIKRQSKLLEEANTELDALNEQLEDRVRRRTAEIEQTKRKLGDEAVLRTRSQSRLALEHAITRELSAADALQAAAPAILKAFCTYLSAETSALWLLSDDHTTVDCRLIESAKTSPAIDLFVRSNLNRKFAKDIGLPGVVWERNAPVWTPLASADYRFPRAQLAAAAGFNTALGIPIKMGDEFFGVIEFFSSLKIEEEQELIEMFDAIGTEIGQFIHRRRIEAERERLLTQEMTLRQQAEKASRLKDEFLATVSHELRTPLNSILGWAQLLRKENLDEQKRNSALDTIFRNAKAQSQLIEDLLDMSRLITGNYRLDLEPAQVRTIVENAVTIVRPQADAKSIRIVSDFGDAGAQIACDAERVQQMVWNLLVNAVKFTPEGGRVEVTTSTSDTEASIAVRDDGAGIDPEFLPHVFDRFRQWDSSSTRKHRGLGLGLAIVTSLAELHGGRVTVASEGLGKGAEFTIFMPRTAIQAERETAPISIATMGGPTAETVSQGGSPLDSVRVLIVEDDLDAAEMLSEALQAAGAETRASHSVSDAFAALSEWVPNAVVSDISMPGEDGYSFIRRLRDLVEPDISTLPAIALTAMARQEDEDRALAYGFNSHMAKPIDIEELTKQIATLVADRRTDARLA